MPEVRTPAQIEADIVRRRDQLAETLDEIGVRMHPSTIIGDAKARVASTIDEKAGRVIVAVNRTVTDLKAGFRREDGAPDVERILPVAMLAVGVVGLLALSVRRKRA
ncbi:DUF3618 domain-containing protein [Streptomyces bambusae]|uniref:DUF3618 domain-containing protein n=1 Tax=Streptomyces bambusae TaxID=1550616 RepID=UPI001CFD5331|nr:DUF3618 domain-containing protein [Streptomyces bambusae]MCB5167243.1 DUF3618 domain-containing protein [Streptomyces bambusae]